MTPDLLQHHVDQDQTEKAFKKIPGDPLIRVDL
jgi:hypothetical protein